MQRTFRIEFKKVVNFRNNEEFNSKRKFAEYLWMDEDVIVERNHRCVESLHFCRPF